MSDNKRITLDGVEYELVPIKEAFQRWLEAIALGAGWAAIVVLCVRAV